MSQQVDIEASGQFRLDRSQITVYSGFGERDAADREYWRSKSPEERLTALEELRQTAYGYDEGQRGLQRHFEVADRPQR